MSEYLFSARGRDNMPYGAKMSEAQNILLNIDQTLKRYSHTAVKKITNNHDSYSERLSENTIVLLGQKEIVKEKNPIRFDFFSFFLCLKGQLSYKINEQTYALQEASCQLIPPGSSISFEGTTDNAEISILLFTEVGIKLYSEEPMNESIKILFDYHRNHTQNFLLSSGLFTRIKTIFQDINTELKSKEVGYMSIVKLRIVELLTILKRFNLSPTPLNSHVKNNAQVLVHKYLELVDKHYLDKSKVGDYAKLLAISQKYLSGVVKSILGNKALFYIHNRKIQEASYLLQHSNLSTEEIASKLNFKYQSEFSRFFKLYAKMTPKQFRLCSHSSMVPHI